jgi:hypothetical protein
VSAVTSTCTNFPWEARRAARERRPRVFCCCVIVVRELRYPGTIFSGMVQVRKILHLGIVKQGGAIPALDLRRDFRA